MRQYPTDSPEASARIVALALLADGAIDLSEIESLQQHRVINKLGLDTSLFDRVVREFCEDMLSFAHLNASGRHELDVASIDALLNEIRDPEKQSALLSAMFNIVNAENSIQAGEGVLISEALKVWHPESRSASVVAPAANASKPTVAVRRYGNPGLTAVPSQSQSLRIQ